VRGEYHVGLTPPNDEEPEGPGVLVAAVWLIVIQSVLAVAIYWTCC
jgi:hypothetical protein